MARVPGMSSETVKVRSISEGLYDPPGPMRATSANVTVYTPYVFLEFEGKSGRNV